ncbi:MAG: hypothetical protein ABFS05_07110 [Bacteroidota bacterium]
MKKLMLGFALVSFIAFGTMGIQKLVTFDDNIEIVQSDPDKDPEKNKKPDGKKAAKGVKDAKNTKDGKSSCKDASAKCHTKSKCCPSQSTKCADKGKGGDNK